MGRWKQEEIDSILILIKEGKTYSDISGLLNRSESSIRNKLNEIGEGYRKYYDNSLNRETKKCLKCEKEFEGLVKDNRKFCSHSCNAKFNNVNRKQLIIINCKCCGSILDKKRVFCSNKCQGIYSIKLSFEKIENGDISLYHTQYKKYLIHKYGNKCMECGWCEINQTTRNVPIQLEHVDGNSENNSLDNLKLLCPNCHSLTPTFGSLNKGKGRKNRKR